MSMGILDALLGRMGYVKLDEYGLTRSSDARIVMMHRRVLDDGMGGRIVGWRAEDPAPTVLEAMDVVPRTAVRAVEAARSSMAMAAHAVVTAKPPAAPSRGTSVGGPRGVVRTPTATTEDEDEWEWELAMARARAAAEEAEQAARSIQFKDVPMLIEVSKSAPVVGVATLTPSRSTGAHAVITSAPKPQPMSAPVPIERARIARGSAQPSSRVMSPPRPPRVPDRIAEARAERLAKAEQAQRAADSRSLPLPPPEDTRTRMRPVPPKTPVRPAAIAAAARTISSHPIPPRFESEITQTDGRPPLPRFSARFR